MHGTGWKRKPIRYGLRQFGHASAHGPNRCGPELGDERNKRDAHLVCRKCDGLHSIGRMEWQQGAQRFAIHRRAVCQCDLQSDLYG